jgi:formylglycine-generating enzyme required for sulfatase activity
MIWRESKYCRSRREPIKLRQKSSNGQQFISISITVLVCIILTVIAAFLPFYLFADAPATVKRESPKSAAAAAPALQRSSMAAAAAIPAPAGELPVTEERVRFDGEGRIRGAAIEPFAIAETEITNLQYQEFVKETGARAPLNWPHRVYPPGTANEPVTMVTWQDAVDYCAWLSRKIGALVRLPTEAEWELAAGGKNGLRYPWGKEWLESAAGCTENGGLIRAVKSYPAGLSPVGAYDLAGNVWEWVADQAVDQDGRPMTRQGVLFRIAKGGAANESRDFIGTQARAALRSDEPRRYLGFRYVIIRKSQNPPASSASKQAVALNGSK